MTGSSVVEKKKENIDDLFVKLLHRLVIDTPTSSNDNNTHKKSSVTNLVAYYALPCPGLVYYTPLSQPVGPPLGFGYLPGPTATPGHATTLPHAFTTGTLHDLATGA
ncbi:hypothetical protein Tco_1234608 [Tanacetum coccineum]